MLRKRAASRLIRGLYADLTRTWMVSRELFWSSSVFTHSSQRQVILPGIVSLYAVHKHKSVHTLTDVQIHTHTITKQYLVLQWNNASWPQNLQSRTYQALEISLLRFKSSSCPLINSQRSSWPGFYTRNPSLLYLKKNWIPHGIPQPTYYSQLFVFLPSLKWHFLIKTSYDYHLRD